MNSVVQAQPSAIAEAGCAARYSHVTLSRLVMVLMAALATGVSLSIAAYAGWQRGNTLAERVMNVGLAGVAVSYVHLLAVRWYAFRPLLRAIAFALWGVGLIVVLYGQVAFFMMSQQHVGAERAAMVPSFLPLLPSKPSGRPITEIARDIARVTADLARADARACEGNCPSLTVQRAILAGRLTALKTEADEQKRLEAEQDRYNEQADHIAALRARLRVDPVMSAVSSWLGTTENSLELIVGVACAVVLEGAAITGWLMASVGSPRADDDESVIPRIVATESQAVVLRCDFATEGRTPTSNDRAVVASDRAVTDQHGPGTPVMSGDDLLLNKVHQAVTAGRIRPTQADIRNLLRCGQQKAGRLKRMYLFRFGPSSN